MNTEKMSIYEKVSNIGYELSKIDIKKSGHNKFAKYKYFELKDLVPPIKELCLKYRVSLLFNFEVEMVTLTALNLDNTGEKIETHSPIPSYDGGSGRNMGPIQRLGSCQTYLRRYLYLALFDIIEADSIDCLDNTNTTQNNTKNRMQNPNKLKNNPNENQDGTGKVLKMLKNGLSNMGNPQEITKKNIINLARKIDQDENNEFKLNYKVFNQLQEDMKVEGMV